MRASQPVRIAAPPLTSRAIVAWFGVYALVGVLSFVVLRKSVSAVMPVWLPVGISFALQLRAAPRQRLPIALAQFVIELALEQGLGTFKSLPLHLAYSAAASLESCAAAVIAIRLNHKRDLGLDTLGELRAFLLASAAATFAAGVLAAIAEVHYFPDESYATAELTWMQADFVAFIVLTPLVLAARDIREVRLRGRQWHALALLVTLVGGVTLLFGREVAHNSPLVALTFLLFPPLIWAALTFSVVGAATASVLLSILIGLLTELGLGPIAALGLSEFARQLIAQGFVGLLAGSALTLGVLTRQQRAMRANLRHALNDTEEAAARLRSFFDGTPEMLAAVDRNGRVVLANRRWMEEFSAFYNQADVIGLHVEALAAFAGEQAAATVEWWRRALNGESIAAPWSVSRQDGSTSTYEMSLAPLSDPAGRVVGAYMSVRDVADLRERQEAESRARRLETVGRLAGGVAHDFNNIVMGIQGYAQLLADSIPPAHPGRRDLDEIRKAGDRAANLTRQLLAYARRQMIEPRQVHVLELLNGLTGLLRRVIGEGIDLTVEAHGELWPVRADPGQLEQVIMNLAVNARDAMPSGGRLLIECENTTVGAGHENVRDLAPGEYVAIAVADTGAGMAPEVLERVFEPFYTTKLQGQGTGLGLATVDGIVQQFGGAISAESAIGVGTTLRLLLPRDEAPASSAVSAEAPAPSARQDHEHIILVEDDAALRPLARRILEHAGFSVDAYEDGETALAAADATLRRAAILVTDVVLPGMHGRDLADRLRARVPHLIVLFVSGYTEDAVSHHGVLDEGVNFLQKPFTPERLVAKIRALLSATQ